MSDCVGPFLAIVRLAFPSEPGTGSAHLERTQSAYNALNLLFD